MFLTWLIVACVLWFVAIVLAFCVACSEGSTFERKDWESLSALFVAAMVLIAIWPLLIPMALIAGVIYGLVNLCRPSVWRYMKDNA